MQVLELGVPVVVVLNMADIATERGMTIDVDRLSQRLHAPVVRMVASRGEGFDRLQEIIQGMIR